MYCENVGKVITLCDKDMEYVPSGLKLLVDGLAHVQESLSLS